MTTKACSSLTTSDRRGYMSPLDRPHQGGRNRPHVHPICTAHMGAMANAPPGQTWDQSRQQTTALWSPSWSSKSRLWIQTTWASWVPMRKIGRSEVPALNCFGIGLRTSHTAVCRHLSSWGWWGRASRWRRLGWFNPPSWGTLAAAPWPPCPSWSLQFTNWNLAHRSSKFYKVLKRKVTRQWHEQSESGLSAQFTKVHIFNNFVQTFKNVQERGQKVTELNGYYTSWVFQVHCPVI